MKLAWVTDIHLNFLESADRKRFYQDIVATKSNAILVSGDIAEAQTISDTLEEMAQHIAKPIYFVLGNHDYYQSSVENVRQAITKLSQASPLIHWLPETGLVQLETFEKLRFTNSLERKCMTETLDDLDQDILCFYFPSGLSFI